jgi:hypothetical protein
LFCHQEATMPYRPILCLVVTGACCLSLSAPARAQEEDLLPPRRPYVEIPFEGDLDRVLAGKLFKTLLEQMGKNPGIGTKAIPDVNLDHPQDRSRIEKFLERLPEGKEKKALESLLQKDRVPVREQRQDKTAPAAPPAPPPAGPETVPPAPPSPAASDKHVRDDALARWTRELLDQARDSEYGEMVMKSPALRQGLEDLQKALASGDNSQPGFSAPPQLARWAERLRPSRLASLPNLRWLKPEVLWQSQPRLRLPAVDIAPAVPRLALGLPQWGGSGADRQALGHGLFWVAFLAAATLLCWQVLRRWSRAGRRRRAALLSLGPWPVDPAHVRTPAELILAFEHLSLLQLGPDARSWNHRAIAVYLGGRNDEERWRLAADELAALYERARYAPATDSLPEEALASARRSLCLLAGVASA